LPSGTAETPFDEFSTGEASFVVDESFRIVRWSDRATELLGVEKSDAMGKRCYEIINGADANNPVGCGRDCPVLTGTRRNPEVPDYDMLSVSPQGEYRWLNITTLIRGGPQRRSPWIEFLSTGDAPHKGRHGQKDGGGVRPGLGKCDTSCSTNSRRS